MKEAPTPWLGGCVGWQSWERGKRRQRVKTLEKHRHRVSTNGPINEVQAIETAIEVLSADYEVSMSS